MQRYGRYVVRQELGGGGMGIVYLAYDPVMGREVALRVISERLIRPTTGSENVLKRFSSEVKDLDLWPWGIVPVYDLGQEGNELYLVMQLMSESLADKLGAGALSMRQIVHILRELAPALDEMHQRSIIHGNLKPAHILFDKWGNPAISGFGLAKLTQKGVFARSAKESAYMSPEQVRGESVDGRSDIYSLGGILFHMLTGEQPVHSAMADEQRFSHVNHKRLTPLRSDLSPAWQALIDRVMAKTPAERPANASQLVNELKMLVSPAQMGIGSERICAKACPDFAADGCGQVYVAAGKFLMGSRNDDLRAFDREKPQREVYLDAYWIDKSPVTNAMFAKFVQETGYQTDAEKEGYAWGSARFEWRKISGANWRHPGGPKSNLSDKDNHPVVCVSFRDANAYAQWAGQRLPSEAEWEKAAGGTDGRKWPWGNKPPMRCNFGWNVGDTTPVGIYPAGASPYGALDMVGNVSEWCHENFDKNDDAFSPFRTRALRGGGWPDYMQEVRVRFRYLSDPFYRGADTGFRCACSPSLQA